MAKKRKRRLVSNVFSVITAPDGKDDEKGQELLAEARKSIEKAGYKLVRTAEYEDELGRRHGISSGKLPSENNFLLIGEKPV